MSEQKGKGCYLVQHREVERVAEERFWREVARAIGGRDC